jgi:hypothetical protein
VATIFNRTHIWATHALFFFFCIGCGSTAVKPETRTIVFTKGDVVTATANRAEKEGRKIGSWQLPPLPVRLEETSKTFQQGFQEAMAVIARTGPEAPADASPEQFDAWVKSGFQAWLRENLIAVKKCKELLAQVAKGPVDESIVAGALVGLIEEHFNKIFDETPIPPKLRGDQELIDLYRQELNRARLPSLKESMAALVHCVSVASAQQVQPYDQWKLFCAEHAYALDAAHRNIRKRVERVDRLEREQAERLRLFGPRPEGPAVCWKTRMGIGPMGYTGDEAIKSGQKKANHPGNGVKISPRDQEYGLVDTKTGVRVSIQSDDNDHFSLAPLHTERTRGKLAACFAKSFTQAQQVTAAIKVTLSLSQQGKIDSAKFETVDTTIAAYLSPGFAACLQKSLGTLHFPRSATGEKADLNAVVCLRRSMHDLTTTPELSEASDAIKAKAGESTKSEQKTPDSTPQGTPPSTAPVK